MQSKLLIAACLLLGLTHATDIVSLKADVTLLQLILLIIYHQTIKGDVNTRGVFEHAPLSSAYAALSASCHHFSTPSFGAYLNLLSGQLLGTCFFHLPWAYIGDNLTRSYSSLFYPGVNQE